MSSDMDELYRKAAESYPLNTGKPDWKALLQKMENNEPGDNKTGHKKNGLKTLLLLLLFFPLALSDLQIANKILLTGSQNNKSIVADSHPQTTIDKDKIVAVYEDASSTNNLSKLYRNSTTSRAHINRKNVEILPGKETGENKYPGTAENKSDYQHLTPAPKEEMQSEEVLTTTNKENKLQEESKEDETLNTFPKETTGTKQQEERRLITKKFYAGIIAGPEMNAVKMQNFHKVGFNAGIIAGYRFSNSIQVETGFLLGRKYYRSKGEYFKTNKITLPAGTIINKVTGYCDMTEIPLVINYVLRQKARHNIYVSAGVSSYIMKKEVYDFEVTRNSYTYPRSMEYDKPGSYAFAAISLGAGYEKKIGKNGNLRIAPSIKLPLKKMGTGSLPIQSGTLYLGYSYNLF